MQTSPGVVERVRAIVPGGIDHIIEVAFAANISTDLELLAIRGSIAAYATDVDVPSIPFWPLLFKSIRVDFLGSDDFTPLEKGVAAGSLNEALMAGWSGFEIIETFSLNEIAAAHERLESPARRGRVVVVL
jgi:NADPH2:quinone reductase